MDKRRRLMEVALGQAPPDTIIENGVLVDVATRRLVDGVYISISGGRVASISKERQKAGPKTRMIDAGGAYLAPGLVDAHYHIESSRLSPRRHAQITLPHGTTTLFEGSHEICNPLGLDGVRYLLEEAEGLPQKIFVGLSSATPPTPYETAGAYIGGKEAEEALKLKGVAGVDEVMDYTALFNGEERLHGVIEAGLASGKVVEGHGVPSPPQADAFLATGVSSTHFSGDGAKALALLERGCFLELKSRDSRQAIRELLAAGIDWQMVGMCVDDRPAEKISQLGHLDYELRISIEEGLNPVTAIQLATLNNARHWRKEHEVGIIAPGRHADILFLTDLAAFKIDRVMADGEIVAEKGKLTIDIPIRPAPAYVLNTIKLKKPLTAGDFAVKAPANRASVKAAVLRPFYFSADLPPITQELPADGGLVQRDLPHDVNKVAIVRRDGGGIGVSFWELGYQHGAVAMSVLHDTHNISVVGATDSDMAAAVNRVAEMGGGIAVVRDGAVKAAVPLPIAGLMTDRPLPEVVAGLDRVNEEAAKLHPGKLLGPNPVDTQTFIFLTCFPWGIVLTDRGLVNVRTGQPVPTVW
ncbi:MAG: amidohydrolase family protein [Candidatus Bathyarchaeota archaeon]|nr:amidohydrolase family protein [Candidatus Bathyarchaeota archaeon]